MEPVCAIEEGLMLISTAYAQTGGGDGGFNATTVPEPAMGPVVLLVAALVAYPSSRRAKAE